MGDTRDEFDLRSLSVAAQDLLTLIRTKFAADDRRTALGRWRFGRRSERDRIIDAAFTLRRVVGAAARRTVNEEAHPEPDLGLMDRYLMSPSVRDEAASIVSDIEQLRPLRGIDVHAAARARTGL